MMVGMITRLTDQKGLDLVERVMDWLLTSRIQLVIIGTGDKKYEDLFRRYEWERKEKVSANICFNDDRAHKLYAAADAMLMPSLFEPCGLTQLISLRYGTVPIVRETGGLKDTVEPYNEYVQTGTGFSFANYNAEEMLDTIFYAERVFYDTRSCWDEMVRRGMEQDFSWRSSAQALPVPLRPARLNALKKGPPEPLGSGGLLRVMGGHASPEARIPVRARRFSSNPADSAASRSRTASSRPRSGMSSYSHGRPSLRYLPMQALLKAQSSHRETASPSAPAR